MLKLALFAATSLSDLGRDGVRLVAVVAALFLWPVLVVIVATGALLAVLISIFPRAIVLPAAGGLPAVPPDHLVVMLEVSAETGVPWELLAAIASVESGFGANMSTSSAGAIGYGQFLPSSWAHWGQGGDPYDYRDAIPAMAQYLLDHNVLADVPNAVWGYNHSWDYVALVLERAAYYGATENLAPTPPPLPPLPAPSGRPS